MALTGLYQVRFSQLGGFAKLQAALGFEPDHVWTKEERQRFLSGYTYFQAAFRNEASPVRRAIFSKTRIQLL